MEVQIKTKPSSSKLIELRLAANKDKPLGVQSWSHFARLNLWRHLIKYEANNQIH